MLNTLGGGGVRGNQLLQFGSTFNSLSGTLTPLFVGALIGTVTAQTTMGDVTPLLFLAMGVFAVASLIITFVAIPEPHLRRSAEKQEKAAHSPGTSAIRCWASSVSSSMSASKSASPVRSISTSPTVSARGAGLLTNGAAVGGAIAAVYWLLMLVGRSLSSLISGKVSSRVQLLTVSATAIVFVLLAIFIPKEVTVMMPGYSVGHGFSLTTSDAVFLQLFFQDVGAVLVDRAFRNEQAVGDFLVRQPAADLYQYFALAFGELFVLGVFARAHPVGQRRQQLRTEVASARRDGLHGFQHFAYLRILPAETRGLRLRPSANSSFLRRTSTA